MGLRDPLEMSNPPALFFSSPTHLWAMAVRTGLGRTIVQGTAKRPRQDKWWGYASQVNSIQVVGLPYGVAIIRTLICPPLILPYAGFGDGTSLWAEIPPLTSPFR